MQKSKVTRPKGELSSQTGVTLFEIILVTTIFVSIILLANQALFSTFQGGSKSQLSTKVKQAASYVFELMERDLRSATSISTCTTSSITYSDQEGAQKSFNCNNIGTGGYISSATSTITTNDIAVTACSFTCTTSGSVRTVDIDMTFAQSGSTANLRAAEKVSYRLKTQVFLRN